MQIAYAELYIMLATMMRRFEMKLCEGVDRGDVDVHRDYFIVRPRDGSKGVRVTVK